MLTRPIIFSILAISVAAPECAQAYIDPGTGSQMLQILAAGALGALLAFKGLWHKIASWMPRRDRTSKS